MLSTMELLSVKLMLYTMELLSGLVKDAWYKWIEAVGRLEDWRIRITRRLFGVYGGVVPLQKKINQPQLEQCSL